MGGTMPSERKYYNKKAAGEDAAKYGGVITPGTDSKGREVWTVRSEEAQRELEAQTLEGNEKVTRIRVAPTTKETKGAAKALRDSLKKSATQETIHERLVRDAEKMQIGSKAPPEPKKRGRPPKVAVEKKGAVAVAEKPPEKSGFAPGTFAMPETLRKTQYRSSPEAISKVAAASGIGLSPEQIKESQRKAQEVIKEKAQKIAGEPSRKPTAAEQVAEEWKARGETPPEQADIMARAAERERTREEEAEREAKFIGTVGEPQTPGQKRRYEEVRALKREAEAPEKARAKIVEDAAKTRRAEELRTAREGKRASKSAKKTAARQESARKYVVKQYLKEGRQLPAGVSDYVTEKEKFQTEKAVAIGRKKAARIETAKQAQKYQQKVAPEEGKWTYAEAQAKAKEMAKEKVPGRPLIKIGKRVIMSADEQKRKTYILRGKKPGEYKVVAGTKEELETPTSLKAALAKEKRKFKKRKKLLEAPLREVKRAKKVLRTTAKHGAKQLLRRSSSMNITRGKHPAIGNVSMEYRRARIATPILVPKSIAGQYTTGEDTKRRR